MSTRAKYGFFGVLLFALIYNLFLPLHPDEAYYWTWSRQLALSYFDGPPMTAYWLAAFTKLLGNSVFTIKSVSVVCLMLGAWLSYRFCKRCFDQPVAEINLLLILLMPLIQAGLIITTPDSPLILFWMATLYSFYLAIEKNQTHHYYLAGVLCGCLLLSKYTGILLPISLLGYLATTPKHRHQFKKPQLYIAAILAVLVFSPVIIWNIQHDWVSVAFQWEHGHSNKYQFSFKYLGDYLGGQLGVANPILLIALIILIIKNWQHIKREPILQLLLWPFAFTLLFFLSQAIFKKSQPNWPAPAYVSGYILLAYFIALGRHYKTLIAGTALSIVAVMILKFPSIAPFMPQKSVLMRQFMGYEELAQQANLPYQPGRIILSGRYQNASELAFYLPGKPQIYIITPDRPSQYTLWSQDLKHNIEKGDISEAWYIGEAKHLDQLKQYFGDCSDTKALVYDGSFIQRHWVMVHCQ